VKRVSLTIALLVASLGAVEIIPVMGGKLPSHTPTFNRFSESTGSIIEEDGFGYTAGVLGDFKVTRPVTSLNLSIQTGFMFQYIRYRIPQLWYLPCRYNNLILPLTLNANPSLRKGREWFIGAGSVLIHNMWGSMGYRDEPLNPPTPLDESSLRTYLGALFKGGTSINLSPKLSLRPSGSLQLNFSRNELWEWSCYLSIGLAFKL